jgi:hypothetical protein
MLFAEQIPTQTIEHNDHNAAHGISFLKFLPQVPCRALQLPSPGHRRGDNARLVAQNANIAGDLSVHRASRKVW